MVKYGNCSSSVEGVEKNAMLTRRRRENEEEAARKKKANDGARDVFFFLIARHLSQFWQCSHFYVGR